MIPIVQRNRLSREVCFSLSDAANVLQSANVTGPPVACEAIVMLDLVNREGWEEVLTREFPQGGSRSRGSEDPGHRECAPHGLPGCYDHHAEFEPIESPREDAWLESGNGLQSGGSFMFTY
ncbi:hypothetical protein DFH09DRAFT_1072549 [Mycena vulgaris]|nr:hypothetical protein DFH09DRAFT_1072549 [Mycena vulgaris]